MAVQHGDERQLFGKEATAGIWGVTYIPTHGTSARLMSRNLFPSAIRFNTFRGAVCAHKTHSRQTALHTTSKQCEHNRTQTCAIISNDFLSVQPGIAQEQTEQAKASRKGVGVKGIGLGRAHFCAMSMLTVTILLGTVFLVSSRSSHIFEWRVSCSWLVLLS